MVNEIVMNKIKKLLALTSSPNEAEASVAMEKVHQFLKEYNLSISDITEDNRFSIIEENYLEYGKERKWRTLLCIAVSSANYCSPLKAIKGGNTTIRLVGKEHNILASKLMLDYLMATIERLSKNIAVKQRESYKLGIVNVLSEKLKNLHKQDMVQCNALVVVEKASIEQYLKEKKNITNEIVKYKVTNSVAYYKGYQDGNNISLNHQINTNQFDGSYIS
jgi:hypothetical protein